MHLLVPLVAISRQNVYKLKPVAFVKYDPTPAFVAMLTENCPVFIWAYAVVFVTLNEYPAPAARAAVSNTSTADAFLEPTILRLPRIMTTVIPI